MSATAAEKRLAGATNDAATRFFGLLLDGRTLYAVVRSPGDGIVVIRLRHDLRSGTVQRTITSDDFAGPTTVDDFGNRLYAVNARFGPPPPPDEYWVTQVRKRR